MRSIISDCYHLFKIDSRCILPHTLRRKSLNMLLYHLAFEFTIMILFESFIRCVVFKELLKFPSKYVTLITSNYVTTWSFKIKQWKFQAALHQLD